MDVAALPFIDEHAVGVDADRETVWRAVADVDRSFAGPPATLFTTAVGCEDTRRTGPRPLAEGAAMPGFRVEAAEPPARLVLVGRHRFSSYALIFHVDDLGDGRSRVRAETRAAFPGAAGAAYRALVIGSGGHVLGVRRLLAGIRRRAEEPAAPGGPAAT